MIVGVLGGGQLGRMLALAGYPLGLRFRFFDPAESSTAGLLAPLTCAGYDDAEALRRFAAEVDLITYEFENVPVDVARMLAERVPVFPPPLALEMAQDRLVEKQFFTELGIPTPAFAPVGSRAELDEAVSALGLPAVLKTRRLGYDGKGQQVLRAPADCGAAWEALGSQPLILERFVPFQRELSIVAARGRDGALACYPLVENHHREGILRLSLAPAQGVDAALQRQAEGYAAAILGALGYVGVLALELFQVDGQLLANEMAPRVHNSGHWTIEGAQTSQFEQHLRAVLGLPLGSTEVRCPSAMVNLIGTLPDSADLLALPDAHLHLYDKAPAPGRKLGHLTLLVPNAPTLHARCREALALVGEDVNGYAADKRVG